MFIPKVVQFHMDFVLHGEVKAGNNDLAVRLRLTSVLLTKNLMDVQGATSWWISDPVVSVGI